MVNSKPKLYFKLFTISIFILSISHFSCKKLVEIGPPANSIVSSEVFKDSVDASAAIAGIYRNLYPSDFSPKFGSGILTEVFGLYSDELVPYTPGSTYPFYTNSVFPNNSTISTELWSDAYMLLYQCNACIEGLNASTTLSSDLKEQLLGEAKFLRALIYFYLVNIYGDIPYITSTKFAETSKSSRSPKEDVYRLIIQDLNDAKNALPADYHVSNGERTRVNKWAATALLARVYLYVNQWSSAEEQSSLVLNSSLYSLSPNLNEVFFTNSSEAILQWNQNVEVAPFNLTPEGLKFIPFPGNYPNYYLSSFLMSDFETDDNRRTMWIDSIDYQGTLYYFPYKYKTGPSQYSPNTPATEYYTVLRLGEQYLIRAEASVHQNKLLNALNDLNNIRNRAGLPSLSNSLTQEQLLQAIEHERRIELFSEWGHRWFDIKRIARANEIMNVISPMKANQTWSSFKQILPIPLIEIQRNPFVSQNPGY